MIRQNIVFVENKAGSLKKVTGIVAEAGINIYGFACFDAPEFALFRMVCSDPERAEQLLNEKGYMNRITQVIAVDMKDEVGSLDRLLGVLSDSNVNLNYIYTSFHRADCVPVVIIFSDEVWETESVLKNHGFHLLGEQDELDR